MDRESRASNALLAEQRDFYRADAVSYDRWLNQLVDPTNHGADAVAFRAGRQRVADLLDACRPLGRVLEIAAGTGLLSELLVEDADELVVLDTSAASLELARRRLGKRQVEYVEADVFDWEAAGRTFETVAFSSWLHHVPVSRFDQFWAIVDGLLAANGRAIFDFPPDTPTAAVDGDTMPDQPSDDYALYRPTGGVGVRDHEGRRWRVVHELWRPDHLRDRLAARGWHVTSGTDGWFAGFRWWVVTRGGSRASRLVSRRDSSD
jgi:SAM-dependent methyltransferase